MHRLRHHRRRILATLVMAVAVTAYAGSLRAQVRKDISTNVGIIGLTALRHSRYARRWIALNNSPAASAMVGMDVVVVKSALRTRMAISAMLASILSDSS